MENYVNNIWTNLKTQTNALPAYPCDKEHDHNLCNDNKRNFYFFNDRWYCRTKLCGDFLPLNTINFYT